MFKHKRKHTRWKYKKATFFFVLIIFIFFFLTRLYFQPPLMAYAKQKSTYYASVIINDAVSTQIVPNIDMSKIIFIETKSNGYVSSVVLDVFQVNMLLTKMTKQIQDKLIEVENNKSSDYNNLKIPLGVIFDNPLLSNLGPDMNIQLKIVGSIKTDVLSSVKPYGINNSIIEVNIVTKVKFQVLIPFQKDEIEVVTHTPLLIKIVQGDVPHYYYMGGGGPTFNNPPNDNLGPSDAELLQ